MEETGVVELPESLVASATATVHVVVPAAAPAANGMFEDCKTPSQARN